MRKDIEFPAVEGVQVAITRYMDELNQPIWEVHFINYNPYRLDNILVTSTGYSPKDTDKNANQQTTTIRRHFEGALPNTAFLIEPIDPALFHLCNEYWISYYVGTKIYDKKFIFLPDTLIEKNLQYIELLGKEGVLHS